MILSSHIYSKEMKEVLLKNLTQEIIDNVVSGVETYGIDPQDAVGCIVSATINLCARFNQPVEALKTVATAMISDKAIEVLAQTVHQIETLRKEKQQ